MRYPRIFHLASHLIRGVTVRGKSRLKEPFTLGPWHSAVSQAPEWAIIAGEHLVVFRNAYDAAEAADAFIRYGADFLAYVHDNQKEI